MNDYWELESDLRESMMETDPEDWIGYDDQDVDLEFEQSNDF